MAINGFPVQIGDLLDRFEAQLSLGTGLHRDWVFTTEQGDNEFLNAPNNDRFITVTPTMFPIAPSIVTGGGRPHTAFDLRLRVSAYARVQQDQEFKGNYSLKGIDGALALAAGVVGALQLFMPVDGDGNGLLREHMRIVNLELVPKRTNDKAWSYVPTVWEAKFNLAIAETVPA